MALLASCRARSRARRRNHPHAIQLLAGLCTLLCALGLSSVTSVPASAQPTTYYVAADGTNAGNGCTSPANPCATISYALTHATSGDTIEVSGIIIDSVAGADGVTISGAEASPTSPAAITGGIAGAGLTVDNLTVDGGITFTAGDNTVSRSRVMGTGIGAHDADVTVTRSTISSGGISAEPGSVTVSDSTISGGGVAASYGTATVSDSAISGNMGDGISIYQGSVSVNGSTISGNTGDGIDGYPWSGITVANSTISGNGFRHRSFLRLFALGYHDLG